MSGHGWIVLLAVRSCGWKRDQQLLLLLGEVQLPMDQGVDPARLDSVERMKDRKKRTRTSRQKCSLAPGSQALSASSMDCLVGSRLVAPAALYLCCDEWWVDSRPGCTACPHRRTAALSPRQGSRYSVLVAAVLRSLLLLNTSSAAAHGSYGAEKVLGC